MTDRTVTDHEMDRRLLMARAKEKLTFAMSDCEELTALEWLNVLHEMSARMIAIGLKDEWND